MYLAYVRKGTLLIDYVIFKRLLEHCTLYNIIDIESNQQINTTYINIDICYTRKV